MVLAEPPGDDVLSALRAVVGEVAADGATLRLGLEEAAQVDAVVDLLRGEGMGIRELRPRASLEDVFVELMSRAGGGGGS